MANSEWESVEDMLTFAIDREQEAVDFYTDLAARTDHPAMKPVFKEFAAMEQSHKLKLVQVRHSGSLTPSSSKVLSLKIADYLVSIEPGPDSDYRQILIVAMKRELAAQNLYNDLAGVCDDPATRDLLLALAQEEAKHKRRFESEYEEFVLKDN